MTAPAELIIDVHGLKKSFAGKLAVIGVSLQVEKGEIFGFLGPNGSGKTTTIRMLCGLLTPDAGSGHCLGHDVIKDSYAIKCQVGYMPQRFSLYDDLSIYENLEFIASIYDMSHRKERIAAAINHLGLEQHQNQLVGELSGGWKQRLALSAALLHQPKLLLLDEPTAGVDPKARREFWEHIHHLAKEGITTLVSTHYMDEAERCTRLAYIMKGHILIRGTPQEIIKHSQLITWEVRGKKLADLAEQLRQQAGVEQVIIYGGNLHISSNESAHLAEISKKYTQYQWRQIETSLEDVFINLVEPEEDGAIA
jgi:ABC-2 type transport system ATP-binding protein